MTVAPLASTTSSEVKAASISRRSPTATMALPSTATAPSANTCRSGFIVTTAPTDLSADRPQP
jgi:hypothetical protein